MGNDRAALVDAQKCRQRHAITLAERHNAIGILKHPTYQPLLTRRPSRKVAGVVVVVQVQYVAAPEQTGSLCQDQFSRRAAAAGDMNVMNAVRRNDPVLCHRQDAPSRRTGDVSLDHRAPLVSVTKCFVPVSFAVSVM